MIKLLQVSALAGLFILLAACGDDATPTATVTPLPQPVPVTTLPPIITPEPTATPTPPDPTTKVDRMQVRVGVHKADDAAAPTRGIATLPIDIDSDTTWRDLFETLSSSERNCMEVALGDDRELSMDSHILAEEFGPEYADFQLFTCLSPENARRLLVSGFLPAMGVEGEPSESEMACLENHLADKNVAEMLTASDDHPDYDNSALELATGIMVCVDDLLLEMVLQFSDRQDLSEEELQCLRAVFENADVELLNAFFLPYDYEYKLAPKITEFRQTLEECAPGLFDGEHTFEPESIREYSEYGDDHADNLLAATVIGGPGEGAAGTINSANDLDYFVLEGAEGVDYRLSVSTGGLKVPGVLPHVEVFHLDDPPLQYGFERDEKDLKIITWRASSTGPYYILVSMLETQVPVPYFLYIPGGKDVLPLTEDEIDAVANIIDNDSTLVAMRLGDYEVTAIGPWVSGEKRAIGAIAEVVLENPVTFRGKVPVVAFEPDEATGRDYMQGIWEIHAEGIRSLVVLVDLSTEAVAGVEVGNADSFAIVGEPVPTPTPTR